MTWTKEEIREAFEAGNTGEHSHMVMAHDWFDYEGYPIYIPRGKNPRDYIGKNDRADECYSYALTWKDQENEFRANHWDYSTDPLAPILLPAKLSSASGAPRVEMLWAPNGERIELPSAEPESVEETAEPELLSGLQTIDEFIVASAAGFAGDFFLTDHITSAEQKPFRTTVIDPSLQLEEYPMDLDSVRKRISPSLADPQSQGERDTVALIDGLEAELTSLRFLIAQAYADLSAHGSPSGLVFDVRQLLESTPAEIHELISNERTAFEDREAQIEAREAELETREARLSLQGANDLQRLRVEDERIAEDRAELLRAAELVASREAELRAEGWDQGAQATRVYFNSGITNHMGRRIKGVEPVNPHRPR